MKSFFDSPTVFKDVSRHITLEIKMIDSYILDPAHVDILAANSDSDDSLASETYPALSKVG